MPDHYRHPRSPRHPHSNRPDDFRNERRPPDRWDDTRYVRPRPTHPDQGGWYGDSDRYRETREHRDGRGGYYPERTYPNPPGRLPHEDEGYLSPDYFRYYDDDEEYLRWRRAQERRFRDRDYRP